MEFTVKAGKETAQVESVDHESALVEHLMARRRVILKVKDGAYVSLYSSCRAFERRVGSNAPIVSEEDIRVSHPHALDDLAK